MENKPLRKITIIREPQLEIYKEFSSKSNEDEYRWRITVNGKIIAASTEGYINRCDCVENIYNVEKRIKQFREKDEIK